MALTRTDLAGAGDTTARTTYTTASFTVASGDLAIAFFTFNLSASSATLPTLGGTLTGITWTQIATQQWIATNTDRITAWYGVCASASTGTLTFTVPAANGAVWSVFKYTGHDTAGPVSSGLTIAEGQPITGPIDVSSLTGALTVWGTAKNSTAVDGTHTGATTIHTSTHNTPSRLMLTLEEAGENSPDVSWGASYNAGMIAFKIREAGAAVTVTPAGLFVFYQTGTPTLAFGGIGVVPSGLAVPVTFGVPTLSIPGAGITVTPASLTTPVTFGVPTLAHRTTPLSLAVAVAFGTPTLVIATAGTVNPAAVVVPVTFGSPSLSFRVEQNRGGEDPLQIVYALGDPTLSFVLPGTVTPSSLTIPLTFGTPTLSIPSTPLTVTPAPLTIPVSFGAPVLITTTAFSLLPLSLTIPLSLGTPSLSIPLPPPVTHPALEPFIIRWPITRRGVNRYGGH